MNSLQFDLQSFAPSTMSFSLPIDDITKPVPYEYRDPYTYTVNGKTLFMGTIEKCQSSLSGGAYSCNVEVVCPWLKLTQKVYRTMVSAPGEAPRMLARGFFGSWDNPYLKFWIAHVMDYAGIAYRLEFDDVPFIAFSVTGDTCEQILLKLFKFCPDMTTFWDFSSGEPVLVFSRSKAPLTLDCKDYLISSCSVEQSKLPMTGVKITYSWVGSDGVERSVEESTGEDDLAMEIEINDDNTGGAKENETNGDPTTPQHQSPSNQSSLQKMTVKGIPVPKKDNDSMGKKFWLKSQPELEDLKLKYAEVETTSLDYDGELDKDGKIPANYVKKVMPYVLSEGSLSTMTKGVKWCKNIIKQRIYCESKMNKKLRAMFPLGSYTKPYNDFSATFIGINRLQMTYTVGGSYNSTGPDGEPLPDDPDDGPPPPDPAIKPDRPLEEIIKSIWDGQKTMGWSGTITVENTDIEFAHRAFASKINIAKMDPRWETMNGVVQTVDYDAQYGTTSINFGLPSHVEIGDMADKQQVNETANETANNAKGPQSDSYPSGGGSSGSWERKKGEQPIAPSISGGISSTALPPPVLETEPGGFRCRVLTEGSSHKLQVSGGIIVDYDGNEKLIPPEGDWKTIKELTGSGEMVYLNISSTYQGEISSADFSDKVYGNTPFRPNASEKSNVFTSIKLAQANTVTGSDPTEYKIVQEHYGTIELSRFGIEEQKATAPVTEYTYGGESGLLHKMEFRTATLKKLRGDEGIRIESKEESSGETSEYLDVKLVKAHSADSNPLLGGVSDVSVQFVAIDSTEKSRIEHGEIKIFIPRATDSNDLPW